MIKILLNAIIFLILFSCKSCNNSLNIDNKLFVSGICVDVNEEEDFIVSLVYPDISEFSLESSKIKGEGHIQGFGKTFYEALDDVITKLNKSIDLDHVKIVISSSKVVHNEKIFEIFLDYLSHNSQLSRRIYFSVFDGEMNDLINFKPSSGEHIQVFLSELIENNGKENGAKLLTLNDLFKNFSQDRTVLAPVLKLSDDKKSIRLDGSYILHNCKFLRPLNTNETMFVNFIRGEGDKLSGNIKINDENLDFQCSEINRKMKVSENGNLSVDLRFHTKTVIKNCLKLDHFNINSDFINKAKITLDEHIKHKSINLIDDFYKSGIDILNIYNHVYKFKNNFWENSLKHDKNWMEKLKINFNINNNIINIGNISF